MEENKGIWIWVFVAVGILLLFGSFGMGGYRMMGYGMGFGFIFMILFWAVVIWLVYALIKAAQGSGHEEENPHNILKRRYAKGELSKKQYEQMRRELGK